MLPGIFCALDTLNALGFGFLDFGHGEGRWSCM
jgi:hypothetical protein